MLVGECQTTRQLSSQLVDVNQVGNSSDKWLNADCCDEGVIACKPYCVPALERDWQGLQTA